MKPPIVLVVSEDPTKLSILKKALKSSAHMIERPDTKSAIELLRTTLVDVVILDSKVNEGHNFKTAEVIRAAVSSETPILLITKNIKKSFAQTALRAGITDFLNEPLDRAEIEQRLAVALSAQDRSKKISQIARLHAPRMRSAPSVLSDRGLLNDQAMKEIGKARKNSTNISLLMIELDAFKKIPASKNSQALAHLTMVLQENLRRNDLLIPQGAGKFIILLPKTSSRAAEIIAETIRTEVLRTSFSIPLSVSIGLISLDQTTPRPGSASDDFEHLMEGVKRATLEAKKTGNKIVSSEEL
jgi:diguanylate cyclase (GGDEF)-like protein